MTDPPIWWFDRCLGHGVPDAIAALGVEVRRYTDLYQNDDAVQDVSWIPEVTARGWVIVTKDSRIRRDPTERAVLMAAKARYVCLASGNLKGEQQIACFTSQWATIERVVHARPIPLIVSVTLEDVAWLDGGRWEKARRTRSRRPQESGG